MNTIDALVAQINSGILGKVASLPCLEDMQLLGLAEPILRREEGREGSNDDEYIPAIISKNSEDYYPFVDDDYPATLYHRLLSRTYVDAGTSRGDRPKTMVADELLLVCWGFRDRALSYDVEPLIYSSLPDNAKALQSDFDRKRIFSGEFQNVSFFLPEDIWLFSLKYRAQYPLDRACIANNICS